MEPIRFDDTMGATRAVLSDTQGCPFEAEFHTTLKGLHEMLEKGVTTSAAWGAIDRPKAGRQSLARRALSWIKSRN